MIAADKIAILYPPYLRKKVAIYFHRSIKNGKIVLFPKKSTYFEDGEMYSDMRMLERHGAASNAGRRRLPQGAAGKTHEGECRYESDGRDG
jgi:hypothetical protein